MKKVKSIIYGILSMILLCSMSVSAFAAENTCETATFSISEEEMSPEQKLVYEKLMTEEEMQVGEAKVLWQDEDDSFWIELTDENTISARGTEVVSKEYTIYRTVLGIKQNVIKVNLECTWISNGSSSKITNLRGTYTKLISNISCSWNSNYTSATDVSHTLGLDVTYNSKSGIVFFSASLGVDRKAVTISWSGDYDV